MPTYDYVCEACEHAFEEFQSMSAKTLRKCPECGKNKLKRLIGTGAGVIFKGSGFWETDYRSESYKKGEKAAKDAASSAKKAESKSDKSSGSDKTKASKSESSTGKSSSKGENKS